MDIQALDRRRASQALELLEELGVSLAGASSRHLHRILVDDGISRRIDFRVATDAGGVQGLVLAAPAVYWRSLLLKHWRFALECVRARVGRKGPAAAHRQPPASQHAADIETGAPPRTWRAPREAWRVIFVGTAADARGKGVAADLYRSIMADRSLVARVARDNTASLRLHRSTGWRLYADEGVVLAVHLRDGGERRPPARRGAIDARSAEATADRD